MYGTPFKRVCSGIDLSPPIRGDARISMSQPDPGRGIQQGEASPVAADNAPSYALSFSQPVHPEHLLLGSQMSCTPSASQVSYCVGQIY